MNSKHSAIVGDGASSRSQWQPRAVGQNGEPGRADAILIEDSPGDRPLVSETEFGKQVGIVGDFNGGSTANRKPLAVGCREVSVANGVQEVDSRSDRGKHELARSARSSGELL